MARDTRHIDKARKTSEDALNLFNTAQAKLNEANEHLDRSIESHKARIAELEDELARLGSLVAKAAEHKDTNARVAQRIQDFLA